MDSLSFSNGILYRSTGHFEKKDIASVSYVSGIVVLKSGKELRFREERNVYDLVLSFNKEEKK